MPLLRTMGPRPAHLNAGVVRQRDRSMQKQKDLGMGVGANTENRAESFVASKSLFALAHNKALQATSSPLRGSAAPERRRWANEMKCSEGQRSTEPAQLGSAEKRMQSERRLQLGRASPNYAFQATSSRFALGRA